MLNCPNLIIVSLITSNLVLGEKNPSVQIAKDEALKSFHRTTKPPYQGVPTPFTNAESVVTSDERTQQRRYSWEFSETNDSPWTGFLFTLAPKTCELSNYCGAIIANPRTLLTSCACVRTFFHKIGYDGKGSDFFMEETGPAGETYDLKELPIYVFHSYYKPHWTEKILTHDWPWKLSGGKDFSYMKQNYKCWQAFMSRKCRISPTNREPWDRPRCGISTIAVLGIEPNIDYMPHLPWPTAPVLYETKGAILRKQKNGYFWELPYSVPVFDRPGFSLTSYFMRMVNGTNHVKSDIGGVVYLPESMIMMDFVLTNQTECVDLDWARYYGEGAVEDPPWPFKTEVSCLMARDPLMIGTYRAAWEPVISDLTTEPDSSKPKDTWRENMRLCGSGIGFPVWTAQGLHGMTVTMIRCEHRPQRPALATALPFTLDLVQYIEGFGVAFLQQEEFVHLEYDVPKFQFAVIEENRDPVVDYYLKPYSFAVKHRSSKFLCFFAMVLFSKN